jgi:hypothetical protein
MVQHRAASCQPRHALFAKNLTTFSPGCACVPLGVHHNDGHLPFFYRNSCLGRSRAASPAAVHAATPCRYESAVPEKRVR